MCCKSAYATERSTPRLATLAIERDIQGSVACVATLALLC
jgi:hypothetical protein